MGKRLSLLVLFVVAALGPAPGFGAEDTLPNLRPLPAFDVRVTTADRNTTPRRLALRFSVSNLNDSAVPFELLGAPPRDTTRTAASQCVRFAGRACIEHREAGDFVFHPSHGHWHLNDYARYDLRALTPEGAPDMRPEGLVATGGKVSFCLIDYARPRDARPVTEDPFDSTGFYHACIGLFQGISPGWADIYEYPLEGQQIVIDGVPDGRYAIVVTVDPDGRLHESDRSDNVSSRTIEIWDGGTKAVQL